MICIQCHHAGEVLLCPRHALKVVPVHKPFRILFEENATVRERNLYIDVLKGLATFLRTAKLRESVVRSWRGCTMGGMAYHDGESGERKLPVPSFSFAQANAQWVLSVSIAIVSAMGELVKIITADFIGSDRCDQDTKESLASLRCTFHGTREQGVASGVLVVEGCKVHCEVFQSV